MMNAGWRGKTESDWAEELEIASMHGHSKRCARSSTGHGEYQPNIETRWETLRRVGIRIIQLMRGHASSSRRSRYLNVTDEELRRGMEMSWNNKDRPPRPTSR